MYRLFSTGLSHLRIMKILVITKTISSYGSLLFSVNNNTTKGMQNVFCGEYNDRSRKNITLSVPINISFTKQQAQKKKVPDEFARTGLTLVTRSGFLALKYFPGIGFQSHCALFQIASTQLSNIKFHARIFSSKPKVGQTLP